VVLLADVFNTYFEPENLRSALAVLTKAGYRVHVPGKEGGHPLDEGRTLLAAGMVDKAKERAQEVLDTLFPFVADDIPIIGLEPSCLLTLRDEYIAMLPSVGAEALAKQAVLFEEFLAKEANAGALDLKLKPLPQKKALLHGHCHQKAFAAMGAVETVLCRIPKLEVETIASSCCGMAGSFGYQTNTYDISMKMAEMSLLPAIREANSDTVIVADGTSCRHQIKDGANREALHVARVLEAALA
jgi:Fe-S oxidoreductase